MNTLTQTEARNLAIELMGKWGLIQQGWSFKFDNRKTCLGGCEYKRGLKTPGVIRLSKYLLPAISAEKVKDTILHEIAHALDVMDRGESDHSWKWKRWAIKVGADPTRTANISEGLEKSGVNKLSKYTAVCKNGHEQPVHRKWKAGVKKSCGQCSPTFNYDFLLTLRQNY